MAPRPSRLTVPIKVLDGMDLAIFEDFEVIQSVQPVMNIDERGKSYPPVRSTLASYVGPAAPVGGYDAAGRLKSNEVEDESTFETIEAAGTTDGAGALGATAFLAAAGAGLKWKVEDLTVQFNLPTIAGTQVVVSDGIGRVQASGYARPAVTQGTANTAITFSVTAGPINCDVVIRGRARRVV